MIYFVLASFVIFIGFVFYQCWILASPSRRAIQEYHLSWLDSPQRHGVSIEKTLCIDEKVPALVVTPTTEIGKRGEKIREQLTARGCQIPQIKNLTKDQITHTVVLLHGRSGRKEDLLSIAERFCAVGFRCILIDLPAHGDSPVNTVKFGSTEWEQDIPYKVLLECSEKYNFSPDDASLWGMSMGGSFANSALADKEHGSHWKKAIIVCSFDKLSGIIHDKIGSETIVDGMSTLTHLLGGAEVRRLIK